MSDWISVEERLPKISEGYKFAVREANNNVIKRVWWCYLEGQFKHWDTGIPIENAIYWKQYKPDPPEGKEI